MEYSTLARPGGLATILGGLLFVLSGLVFNVYTHGTTSTDLRGTLFGPDGTDLGRMEVAWPALLLVGVVALHLRYAGRLGRTGRTGLVASALALALQIVSILMQWWLKDRHNAEDFESVTPTLGFYLGALSYLVLGVGMVVFGVNALRRRLFEVVLGLLSPGAK